MTMENEQIISHGRIKTSKEATEIYKALCLAQGSLRPAVFDKVNPHYKSKYASLASVSESIKSHLCANGLGVIQDVFVADKAAGVVTRIIHSSGQWIEFGPLLMPTSKNDCHGCAAALTYAKRYALSAALGVITDDDDDANAAIEGKKATPSTIKFISKEQISQIQDLVSKTSDPDSMKSKILERLAIKHLGAIPEDKYFGIVSWLEEKSKEAINDQS